MQNTKDTAIDIIRSMPDDVDLEDIMEELYFKIKVNQGLKEANEGQAVSLEEVKAELDLL